MMTLKLTAIVSVLRKNTWGGQAGSWLAGCVLLSALNGCSHDSPAASDPPPAAANELLEPPVLASANGLLDVLVVAKAAPVSQFSPYPFTGWVYDICARPLDGSTQCPASANGNLYGGSRLQVSQGDTLKVRLVNKLPPMSPMSTTPGAPGNGGDDYLALNPTNLHLHGMLVSPRYATAGDPSWGDNVFVYNFNSSNGAPSVNSDMHGTAINDVIDYQYQFPTEHPSGLYWFHPHVHGISQTQLSAGLGGLITIGKVSDYACGGAACTGDAAPASRHLMLKDVQVLSDGSLLPQVDSNFCGNGAAEVEQAGCAGMDGPQPRPVSYQKGRWFFTVNGQTFPTITVRENAGEIWRIVNASASTTYRLMLLDSVSGRPMLMRVVSVDGVSIDVGAGTDPTQLIDQAGNKFDPVACPTSSGAASGEICTSSLLLMPASRVEVWVSYRDANGVPAAAPAGASAVLRTVGFSAGPYGENWPATDLAQVAFRQGSASASASLTVARPASQPASLRAVAHSLKRQNFDVPSDSGCTPLPANHQRRIFFGAAQGMPGLGLGYEELDETGEPVAGTFRDVGAFDPSSPTVCVPLAAGDAAVTERWQLVNLLSNDHSFHIHQTRFSVISAAAVGGSAPDSFGGWPVLMDTLPLLRADGSCGGVQGFRTGSCTTHPATVQIQFAIAGDFVYHCHILSHEDAGMMAVIRVRSAAEIANTSLFSRVLNALEGKTKPQQSLIPRIGGYMCRTPLRREYASPGQ